MQKTTPKIYNKIVFLIICIVYLIITKLITAELRPDHFILVLACNVLFFFTSWPKGKTLFYSLLPFAIYWVVYDLSRAYPTYLFNPVHIIEPYELEKSLFGLTIDNTVMTLNEYFAINNWPVTDFLMGLTYLCWIPIPLAFTLYLWQTKNKFLYQFSYCFLFFSLAGFAVYYLYPAAPPWYYTQYGNIEQFNIPGNPAGLLRFDNLLNINLFSEMYAINPNVFAAIPSMHSGYPLIVLYFAIKARLYKLIIPFVFFVFAMWFSAVYSYHHYFIDCLAAIPVAIFSFATFEFIFKKHILKLY